MRDIGLTYMLKTPICYSYASINLTVKVMSTSFQVNDITADFY